MTYGQARRWLILWSLGASGATILVLFSIPLWCRFDWDDSIRVSQIVVPVFLGYLGSASRYVFGRNANSNASISQAGEYVGLIVRGPVIVFVILVCALLIIFCLSNAPSISTRRGMDVDQLSFGISMVMGLLAATTSVAVSYLFGTIEMQPLEPQPARRPHDSDA